MNEDLVWRISDVDAADITVCCFPGSSKGTSVLRQGNKYVIELSEDNVLSWIRLPLDEVYDDRESML